jgi:N-methylhydantoinase B
VIEIANREPAPFAISAATFDRIKFAAQGRDGGKPGCKGLARMGSGPALPDKGMHVVKTGDSLLLQLPGGGGFGNPAKRRPELLQADIDAGLVSPEAAHTHYGNNGG